MTEKWPSTLIIWRHGQSEANVRKEAAKKAGQEPAWTGRLRDMDSPLTSLGEQQALVLGQELGRRYPANDIYRIEKHTFEYPAIRSNKMIQIILSSPYVRTRQTTAKIIEGLGYTPRVVYDERLREIDFGMMDGIDRATFRTLYPHEADRREKDGKYWYRPPGGENRPDCRMRVHSLLDTLNRDYVGMCVGISTHSVIKLGFRSLLERWGEEEYMQVDREDDVKNASLTVYNRFEQRKLVLQEYNTIVPIGENDERLL